MKVFPISVGEFAITVLGTALTIYSVAAVFGVRFFS